MFLHVLLHKLYQLKLAKTNFMFDIGYFTVCFRFYIFFCKESKRKLYSILLRAQFIPPIYISICWPVILGKVGCLRMFFFTSKSYSYLWSPQWDFVVNINLALVETRNKLMQVCRENFVFEHRKWIPKSKNFVCCNMARVVT